MVLLVEDSEDDSFFFQRAVEKATIPCEVKHVMDGQTAVEYLGQCESSMLPSLIFLDLKMPVVDGFEVLEWLRSQPLMQSIPVVVLSGSNQESDKRRARDLGASDYLVKPITPERILLWLGRVQDPVARQHGQGTI